MHVLVCVCVCLVSHNLVCSTKVGQMEVESRTCGPRQPGFRLQLGYSLPK